MSRVVGITPARGGSVTIPRKNLKHLNGMPLIGHTIREALGSDELTDYVVNTEDHEIRNYAESWRVDVQGRPREFFYDNSVQEVDRLLFWAVTDLEERLGPIDVVVLLYATAPLRLRSHIDATVRKITEEGFDSALTLCEDRTYLWSVGSGLQATAKPSNYDPNLRGPNQKESWNQWRENKAVYAFSRDLLMETGCRIGGKTGFVEMDAARSVDIDTEDDFLLAECLMRRQA